MKASRALAAAAIALAMLIGGCSGSPAKSSAQSYLENLKFFNYPACYQLLSHQDQIDRSIEQFLQNVPMAPDVNKDWFKPIELHTDYVLGDARVEADKAVVPVKISAPDLALWERKLNAGQDSKETPESLAQKSLSDKSYPVLTYDDSFVMVKEGDNWRLVYNFPLKEQIAKMHKQAVELYHKHDFDKAIALYHDIIDQLDKNPATGNEGLKYKYSQELKDIENVKAQIPEAQAYIPKLDLKDVDMKMTASRVPGVFGKVVNNGDRAIDEVEMTVTYYQGKGPKRKTLFAETHTAIVTPLEFTNFSRNVLPFVPTETRDFGFKLTAPADIQQKGTPDLTVSQIIFTQSKAELPKPPPPPVAAPSPAPAAPGAPAAGAPAAANPAPPPAMPKL